MCFRPSPLPDAVQHITPNEKPDRWRKPDPQRDAYKTLMAVMGGKTAPASAASPPSALQRSLSVNSASPEPVSLPPANACDQDPNNVGCSDYPAGSPLAISKSMGPNVKILGVIRGVDSDSQNSVYTPDGRRNGDPIGESAFTQGWLHALGRGGSPSSEHAWEGALQHQGTPPTSARGGGGGGGSSSQYVPLSFVKEFGPNVFPLDRSVAGQPTRARPHAVDVHHGNLI